MEQMEYIEKKRLSLKKKMKVYPIVTLGLLFLFFGGGAIMKIICFVIAYTIWKKFGEEFKELDVELRVQESSPVSSDTNNSIRCSRCGKVLEANDAVCPNCGQVPEHKN